MARKPFPKSLGDIAAGWIEANCCHGPGDVYGQIVRLTDEEHAFLDEAYAIDQETGRRTTDIAVYSRRKGTRKSELGAWLVALETVGPCRAYLDAGEPVARPPVDPSVVCAATTENQGDLVYGAFRAIVEASDRLRPLFNVGMETTYLEGRSGKVELIQTRNASALDGARPTFEVGDEFHLWLPLLHESYETLRRNLRKRHAAQPWLFAPTTAYGIDEQSIAELLHKLVGRGSGRRRAGRMLFDHRQASKKWDLDDAVQIRLAVEEAGGDAFWSNTDGIIDDRATSTSLGKWRRYWLNQPDEGEDGDWWLADHPKAWEACLSGLELVDGQRVALGVDMSLRNDSTAVTTAGVVDGRLVVRARVFVPQPGRKIDHLDVMEHIRAECRRYEPAAIAYDPRFFEVPAALLEDEGYPMIEFPQSLERMVPACARLFTAIVGGEVAHDGDSLLSGHIKAATKRDGERGWTLSRRKSKGNIDATISTVLAVAALELPLVEPVIPMAAWV